MTRLYQRLVIRLMPVALLNAIHIVYEECAASCIDRTNSPFVHPIETFASWLREAHEIGWVPPSRPIPLGDKGSISGMDDGTNPSWLSESDWLHEETN